MKELSETEKALDDATNNPKHQQLLETWTNELVNGWLERTQGLPVTLQLTKLGLAVIDALGKAFKAGFIAGRR